MKKRNYDKNNRIINNEKFISLFIENPDLLEFLYKRNM